MADSNQDLTCTFHPQRETRLRCNRCERPICIQCATHTPTGYRCPECIRDQQKVFITAKGQDYLVAVLVTAAFAFAGSLIVPRFGFFTILIAPFLGSLTVRVVRRLISNRRSPTLYKVITATALITSLPVFILRLVSIFPLLLTYGLQATGGLLSLVWVAVYSGILTSTIYYQLH